MVKKADIYILTVIMSGILTKML